MMNLPSSNKTAGLNVPADSQPKPCGERMGPSDARDHEPKGRLTVAAEPSKASNNRPAPTFRLIGISDGRDAWERTQRNRPWPNRLIPRRKSSTDPVLSFAVSREKVYSYRSATIGSTCIAFLAGIQQAAKATVSSKTATPTNVIGSCGLTP